MNVCSSEKFQVRQHVQTAKHETNKHRKLENNHRQTLISTLPRSDPKQSEYYGDLCKAFVCAKLNQKYYKFFFLKNTHNKTLWMKQQMWIKDALQTGFFVY